MLQFKITTCLCCSPVSKLWRLYQPRHLIPSHHSDRAAVFNAFAFQEDSGWISGSDHDVVLVPLCWRRHPPANAAHAADTERVEATALQNQHLETTRLAVVVHIDSAGRPACMFRSETRNLPLLSCQVLHGLTSFCTCSDPGVAEVGPRTENKL